MTISAEPYSEEIMGRQRGEVLPSLQIHKGWLRFNSNRERHITYECLVGCHAGHSVVMWLFWLLAIAKVAFHKLQCGYHSA